MERFLLFAILLLVICGLIRENEPEVVDKPKEVTCIKHQGDVKCNDGTSY